MANKKFADYPVRNLPMASEALADGKHFICRRQTKNLQSASAPLAIGKCKFFKWEICQPPVPHHASVLEEQVGLGKDRNLQRKTQP